jgi:hypothetical protein
MEEVQLRALKFLPAVVDWQNLLATRYNRCLDHTTASKLTVGEVIESSPDKGKWSNAFTGFRAAWNDSWRYVERFGCMPIPPMYKSLTQEKDTPISFSMPSEKDEGICPLMLARFLGEKHNRFVQRVDELFLMRGRELQRSTARQSVVSSKFFTNAHALTYDLQSGFLPFVEKQCVQYSVSGNVQYDFKKAEQYLLDIYFNGKPLIDLEVRMIQYTNAQAGGTFLLKQKVKQESLPKEMTDKILKELGSPAQARHAQELLETCISFLLATGGSFVQQLDIGDKKLGEYVKTVLLMEEAEFGSSIISQQVKLKHIDALWKLLRDLTVVDPFSVVHAKYKAALDEKSAQALATVCDRLDTKMLVPMLKEFITDQLQEEHIGSDASIKVTIGYLMAGDVYLFNLPWFATHFPENLTMRNILEVWRVIDRGVHD